MGRAPCCDEKEGLKKGPWTPDEDQKLVAYIQEHGHGSWRALPKNAGLLRCGKSCRLRWTNYLRPDIKRGRFSQDEDQMIVHLHAILGNRWSAIASHLPRRTDNEIKNYWNTHLKKRLLQMGIDPVTHETASAQEQLVLGSTIPSLRPLVSSKLSHMSQWDCARAEAEARLSSHSFFNKPLTSTKPFHSYMQPPYQTMMTAKTETHQDSTSFMSSWKAQIAEALRPSFGLVELEKGSPNPVNLQKFLQDWESSLQNPPALKTFSAYDDSSCAASAAGSPRHSGCNTPHPNNLLPVMAQMNSEKLLSGACDFFASGQIDAENHFTADLSIFPPARIDSESPLSVAGSSFDFSVGIQGDSEHQFSPTSTLCGPDGHDSTSSSPCISSSANSDRFELNLTQSCYNNFPLIHQDSVDQKAGNGMMLQETPNFWHRQQAAMMEALQPEFFLQEIESHSTSSQEPASLSFSKGMAASCSLEVGVQNNVPIPQFDFCPIPQDDNKFSFDSMSVGRATVL